MFQTTYRHEDNTYFNLLIPASVVLLGGVAWLQSKTNKLFILSTETIRELGITRLIGLQ